MSAKSKDPKRSKQTRGHTASSSGRAGAEEQSRVHIKIPVPLGPMQAAILAMDRAGSYVEGVLDQANIQDPTHRDLFRHYLNSVASSIRDSFLNSIHAHKDLDIEPTLHPPARRHFTALNESLRTANQHSQDQLLHRLDALKNKRTHMQNNLKLILNSKVARLADLAQSDECALELRLANGRTRTHDLEDYLTLQHKNYQNDLAFVANRLVAVQESHDSLKRECCRMHKELVQRVEMVEKILGAGFERLQEYEDILLDK